jgi:hypothetical protein
MALAGVRERSLGRELGAAWLATWLGFFVCVIFIANTLLNTLVCFSPDVLRIAHCVSARPMEMAVQPPPAHNAHVPDLLPSPPYAPASAGELSPDDDDTEWSVVT